MNWRDVLERALWTFVQGALIAGGVVPVITDYAAVKTFAVAALMGGLMALSSFLKTLAQERLGFLETRHDMIQAGH